MKPRFLLVGLGNIGKAYEGTRHNVGFVAVERLASTLGATPWADKQKFLSFIAEAKMNDLDLLIAKPTTYMNLSGQAIKKIVDFYKLDPSKQMLVVTDDVDLPIGTHRLRMTGGPGTHNGLKSVVEIFGEDFPRLRIGLGKQPDGMDLSAWVLSRLPEEELRQMQTAFDALPAAIQGIAK